MKAVAKCFGSHILISFRTITHIGRLCNASISVGTFNKDPFFDRIFKLCTLFKITLSVLLRVRLRQLLPYHHVALGALIWKLLSFGRYQLLAHGISQIEVDCVVVVPHEPGDGLSHIFDHRELNEKRNQIQKSIISRVIIPRKDRQGTLWLKHVRGRGVVNDDRVFQGSSHK
jgi:hypothetical protein